jgi:hypothetical protein
MRPTYAPGFAAPCGLAYLFLLLCPVFLLVGATRAAAEPRYTAMYGQSCVLCHVNPTGGGMRSLYASQYLVPEELAMAVTRDDALTNLNPEVTPGLAFGADLRTLVYQQEGGRGSTFSMQGDLYVHAQVSAEVDLYLEQGQSRAGEIFGTARVLPLDGYLKAGRFLPDHGWRFVDHQMFNRRYLLDPAGTDDPGVHYTSGLEVGVSPGIFWATASVFEGIRGDPEPRLGDNYAAKIMIQKGFGGLNLGVGASVLRRSGIDGHRRAAGGLWYAGAGPVTWLGQIDETGQDGQAGILAVHEIAVRFLRGADLLATYSFQDPDRSLKSGSRHRTGAGVAVMPAPYFSTRLMVNSWKIDQGPAVAGEDYLEANLVAHFFF